jgi:hypothetical protein
MNSEKPVVVVGREMAAGGRAMRMIQSYCGYYWRELLMSASFAFIALIIHRIDNCSAGLAVMPVWRGR